MKFDYLFSCKGIQNLELLQKNNVFLHEKVRVLDYIKHIFYEVLINT